MESLYTFTTSQGLEASVLYSIKTYQAGPDWSPFSQKYYYWHALLFDGQPYDIEGAVDITGDAVVDDQNLRNDIQLMFNMLLKLEDE